LQERARRRRRKSIWKQGAGGAKHHQNFKMKDLGSLCGFVDCKKLACMLWMEIQIQEVVINSSYSKSCLQVHKVWGVAVVVVVVAVVWGSCKSIISVCCFFQKLQWSWSF
jgi:hypothetical protein